MQLVTIIKTALPRYVLAVVQEFRGQSGAEDVLWLIKAYYERNQTAGHLCDFWPKIESEYLFDPLPTGN